MRETDGGAGGGQEGRMSGLEKVDEEKPWS